MNEIEFWNLIDEAGAAVNKRVQVPDWIRNRLAGYLVDEIVDYAAWFAMFLDRANDKRLLVAGAIICGSLGDDVFTYFRAWLIAQGKTVYEAAIANPDSLADLGSYEGQSEKVPWLEEMLYVGARAFEAKTGGRTMRDRIAVLPFWKPPEGVQTSSTGLKHADFVDGDGDRLSVIFPNLVKRFPSTP